MSSPPSSSTVLLAIEGMVSERCASRIQRSLHNTAGVARASVDFASQTARVAIRDAPGQRGALIDTLTDAVRHAGYIARPLKGRELDDPLGMAEHLRVVAAEYRRRFALAVMFGLPVVGLQVLGPTLEGVAPGGPVWWHLLQLLLTAWVMVAAGWSFLLGAWRAIRSRAANSDLLIGVAIVGAFVGSAVMIARPGGLAFASATMIVMLVCLGRWLEAHLRVRARTGWAAFVDRCPRAAQIVLDDQLPHSQKPEPNTHHLLDRLPALTVLCAVAVAMVAFVANLTWADRSFLIALSRALAVLAIASPYVIGIAGSSAFAVAAGGAASKGLLLRDQDTLKHCSHVQILVFDKTGTLTAGRAVVEEVRADEATPAGLDRRECLALAASAEQYNDDVFAEAIRAKAREWSLHVSSADQHEVIPGGGVRARVDGQMVCLGSRRFLAEQGLSNETLQRAEKPLADAGHTGVLLAVDGRLAAAFGLREDLRPGTAEAVARLRQMGIRVVMVSGDSEAASVATAASAGIDEVYAEIEANGKAEKVRSLQQAGGAVAMAGDGIEDRAALEAADIGICLGAADKLPEATTDVTILDNHPPAVADVLALAQLAARRAKQNLVWAVAYNILAIPLAAYGVIPATASAGVMMLSCLAMHANSLRISPVGAAEEPG